MYRDFWKRKAKKRQQIINMITRDKHILQKKIEEERQMIHRLQDKIREICPHDQLSSLPPIPDVYYCSRCHTHLNVNEIAAFPQNKNE